MQRIDRTEHIRVSRAEADGAISSHEIPGNATRVPVSQRSEARIYIRHQFLDHEILPVTGHWRVDIPGTPQRRVHFHRYKDEFVDDSSRYPAVNKALRATS